MKRHTFFIVGFLSLFLLVFGVFTAQAQVNIGIGDGGLASNAAAEAGYDVGGTTETSFAETIGNGVQLVLSFLGIIFTLLILYAGFLWMNARGQEDQVKKAQQTIQMALIGLVIVLASYAITAFVMNFVFTEVDSPSTEVSQCCRVCDVGGARICNEGAAERYESISEGTCHTNEVRLCGGEAECKTRSVSGDYCL
mgnify:CR=1 FL=1